MAPDPLDEMRAAVARLNDAADAYYNGRGELMTDFEWDALFDRVKALEAETGVTLPESPTNRVSADAVDGRKEAHEFAALSLAKTKQVAEVARWAEGRPIWLSWKLDGLTLVVTYDDGALTKVVTRGDGHIGTNITPLAAGIRGIPRAIPLRGHVVVRGEAVISYADFESFRAAAQEDYANPRNLASGSLTLKDVDELRRRNLQWIPFTLVHADAAPVSWGARLDALDACGLSTVARERLDAPTPAAVQDAIDRWTHKVTNGECPFPVDGLVVTYDDTAYAQTGSVTGHHATRAGLAFKWQDETAHTVLEGVEWSCAVASISPVALFRPVALEGTTVKRASLCNISECERLGIGGAGTEIDVIKANKIIPKCIAVVSAEGRFSVPERCPVCGAAAEVRVSPLSGVKTLRCTDAKCPAKHLKRFVRFASKGGMDIDGLSVQTLHEFVNRGYLRDFADIYRLRDHAEEIVALEGFGEKSCANLMAAVERSRAADPVRLIFALCIPNIGADAGKKLIAALGTQGFLARVESGAGFEDVDGIGVERSGALQGWFAESENRALFDRLLGELRLADVPPKTEGGGSCANLSFVITGDVHAFKNRDAFKAYVERHGGAVTGSVSGKTAYLVSNDADASSAKARKAKELAIPILTEDEFIARFGGPEDAPEPEAQLTLPL